MAGCEQRKNECFVKEIDGKEKCDKSKECNNHVWILNLF